MIPPTETALIKIILDWLKIQGILAWRNNTGAFVGEYKGKKRFVRFGQPGMSDILGVFPGGRILAIEVKKLGGKLKPDQELFLATIQSKGGVAFMADSLEAVEKKIDYFRGFYHCE